jgi:hypothetical protein
MVNIVRKSGDRRRLPSADNPGRVQADLVNSGQDTRITLRDGSTIVLKGVTHIEAVFSAGAATPEASASPIGGALSSGAAG